MYYPMKRCFLKLFFVENNTIVYKALSCTDFVGYCLAKRNTGNYALYAPSYEFLVCINFSEYFSLYMLGVERSPSMSKSQKNDYFIVSKKKKYLLLLKTMYSCTYAYC